MIDKAILSTSEVEALAELPSREVLLAQLLGLLLSATNWFALNEPVGSLAFEGREIRPAARQLPLRARSGADTPRPAATQEEAKQLGAGGSGSARCGRTETGGRRSGLTNKFAGANCAASTNKNNMSGPMAAGLNSLESFRRRRIGGK